MVTYELDYYGPFLHLADIKDRIHVGSIEFGSQSGEVSSHLKNDWMHSTAPMIEDLLVAEYKVMIYVGHLDIVIAYPQTEVYVKALNWTHTEEFNQTPREVWKIGDEVAGYTRQYAGLTHVMVHAASHFVPYDQPTYGFQMIHNFIHGEKFNSQLNIVVI